MNFFKNIFSTNINGNIKTYTVLGIKIKHKRNLKRKQLELLISLLNTKKINKEQISSIIENRKPYLGITTEKRETKVIISLTSYPDRMYDIHYCLYSLLNQSIKADEVILWLGREQFPNGMEDVPKKVTELINNGLTIKFTEDIKSYKKLIPSLQHFPNDIIVTADDDIFYPSNWLEKLYKEYLSDKNNIICHRVHKIGIKNKKILPYRKWIKCIADNSSSVQNFFTGAGGVLYPPHCLYNDVTKQELFLNLVTNADDIWFWAMAILNGRKIKVISEPINDITYINPEREFGLLENEKTLFATNINDNDIQLKNVIDHYPQIEQILSSEK